MVIDSPCPACGAAVRYEQFEGDFDCPACGMHLDTEHECLPNDDDTDIDDCIDYLILAEGDDE